MKHVVDHSKWQSTWSTISKTHKNYIQHTKCCHINYCHCKCKKML